MRVLVAEGDARARRRLCESLARLGFSAYGAEDGAQALQGVRSLRPEALVLALALPVCDGLAVLEKLHALWLRRYPRVLVLTAMGAPARARALRLKADMALDKPMEAEALAPLLRARRGRSRPP